MQPRATTQIAGSWIVIISFARMNLWQREVGSKPDSFFKPNFRVFNPERGAGHDADYPGSAEAPSV